AMEDFQWLLREIVKEGGEATLCEAAFLEGIDNTELRQLFQAERDVEYAELARVAGSHTASLEAGASLTDERRTQLEGEFGRLKRRLDEVVAVDFFNAPARGAAERAVQEIEVRLREPPPAGPERPSEGTTDSMRGRTWVTRQGVKVDRIASAWLIRRFIDPQARFKFVPPEKYRPEAGEVRFDMFEAEFTHEGDHCSFETLLERFRLRDRALRAIGEIVHDIDCKDSRFGRDETAGIAALIDGLAHAHDDDTVRLERGSVLMDGLYSSFNRKRG
ncbi:MAG: chromate resistance protein ChrB domain-containing protein, partial [Gemmatimonadales bacterium]